MPSLGEVSDAWRMETARVASSFDAVADLYRGRTVDLTVVLRDPYELVAQLERSGFSVEECVIRQPYPDEWQSERCYVVASLAAELA